MNKSTEKKALSINTRPPPYPYPLTETEKVLLQNVIKQLSKEGEKHNFIYWSGEA